MLTVNTMSSKAKKCGACGKSPERFTMEADGLVFCDAGCYNDYIVNMSKGVKRFDAGKS